MNDLDRAQKYVAAGISVIPLRLDGSKAPKLRRWRRYQNELPALPELVQWFRKPAGIALICGEVSGGLEVIDFDHDSDRIFSQWAKRVPRSLLHRLPLVKTPAGYHVLYRCESPAGNLKLARGPFDRARGKRPTLIETRGRGGYVVGVGSPQEVHASGISYRQIGGPDLPEIPRISSLERDQLLEAARELDSDAGETPSRVSDPKPRTRERRRGKLTREIPEAPADPDPVADFNLRARWESILIGWTFRDPLAPRGPGGEEAGILDHDDEPETITIFADHAEDFVGTKFDLYTLIHHDGDRSRAVAVISQLGFGTRRTQ